MSQEKAKRLTKRRWLAHLSDAKRLPPGRYYYDHKTAQARDTILVGLPKSDEFDLERYR